MKNLSICGRIRRLKYPATPEGRRNYIQDSFKDESFKVYRIKERIYFALIVITCLALAIGITLMIFLPCE
jgi:hypothetical protein